MDPVSQCYESKYSWHNTVKETKAEENQTLIPWLMGFVVKKQVECEWKSPYQPGCVFCEISAARPATDHKVWCSSRCNRRRVCAPSQRTASSPAATWSSAALPLSHMTLSAAALQGERQKSTHVHPGRQAPIVHASSLSQIQATVYTANQTQVGIKINPFPF